MVLQRIEIHTKYLESNKLTYYRIVGTMGPIPGTVTER